MKICPSGYQYMNHECCDIVERLKKGIKEMESWASNPEFNDNHPYIDINRIIKELQKILGEYEIKTDLDASTFGEGVPSFRLGEEK